MEKSVPDVVVPQFMTEESVWGMEQIPVQRESFMKEVFVKVIRRALVEKITLWALAEVLWKGPLVTEMRTKLVRRLSIPGLCVTVMPPVLVAELIVITGVFLKQVLYATVM